MHPTDHDETQLFRQLLTRRAIVRGLAIVASAPLVAACGGGVAPAATPQTASTSNTAAAAGKPAATRSTAAKGQPEGTVVQAWHTTIAPAWLDPLEYPAFITQYNFAYASHDAVGRPASDRLARIHEILSAVRSTSAAKKVMQSGSAAAK